MSLVLEALRRIEKPGERTGSIGAAVASYSKAPRRRGPAIPLLLGLASGGAMVFLFESGPGSALRANSPSVDEAAAPEAPPARPLKGRAGLPPPLILESKGRTGTEPRPEGGRTGSPVSPREGAPAAGVEIPGDSGAPEPRPNAALTLQAISERDARPIAIINDQLVKEGDRLGAFRIVRIGPDFVEVLHENGRTDTVHFPLPPEPSPTLDPR